MTFVIALLNLIENQNDDRKNDFPWHPEDHVNDHLYPNMMEAPWYLDYCYFVENQFQCDE